jgi:phytoene/squalene synthetase
LFLSREGVPVATPDPTAVQSDFLSQYRAAVNQVLDGRDALKAFRERAAAQGLPAALVPAAFAGTNADLQGSDLSDAFKAMDTIEAVLTDPATHAPTPALIALLKFRR